MLSRASISIGGGRGGGTESPLWIKALFLLSLSPQSREPGRSL